jgi:hypothetical protein
VGRHKKPDKRVVKNTDYDPDVWQRVQEEAGTMECSTHDVVNDALRYYFDNGAGLDQLARELKALQEREAKIRAVMDNWRESPLSESPQRFMIREYLAAKINDAIKAGRGVYGFTIFDAEFKKELMLFLKNMEADGVTALMGYKIARTEWRDLIDELEEKKGGKK